MEAHYDDYTLTGLWRDQGTKGILLIAGIGGSPSGTEKQVIILEVKTSIHVLFVSSE